jgi:hypothetical protein
MRIPILLAFVALALSGCNANQAINPSGQADRCANDPSCNPYNPSSYPRAPFVFGADCALESSDSRPTAVVCARRSVRVVESLDHFEAKAPAVSKPSTPADGSMIFRLKVGPGIRVFTAVMFQLLLIGLPVGLTGFVRISAFLCQAFR